MTKGSIKQEVIFTAKPEMVYDLIMNPEKHADFTQSEVSMSNEIGGTFSSYDGYINGKNCEKVRHVLVWIRNSSYTWKFILMVHNKKTKNH